MYVFSRTQCLGLNLETTSFGHLDRHQAINSNPLYSSYFYRLMLSNSILLTAA